MNNNAFNPQQLQEVYATIPIEEARLENFRKGSIHFALEKTNHCSDGIR